MEEQAKEEVEAKMEVKGEMEEDVEVMKEREIFFIDIQWKKGRKGRLFFH